MFKFSDKNREMVVYSFSGATGEYFGAAHISVPANTGLPQFMTDIKPEEPKVGCVSVFDIENDKWNDTPDYRGTTAYNKETKEAVTVYTLGPLSEHFTFDKPASPFDKWTDAGWLKDESAEFTYINSVNSARKKQLLSEVSEQIIILSDAIDFGEATEEEIARLKLLKTYRLTLNRVDITQPVINWPELI